MERQARSEPSSTPQEDVHGPSALLAGRDSYQAEQLSAWRLEEEESTDNTVGVCSRHRDLLRPGQPLAIQDHFVETTFSIPWHLSNPLEQQTVCYFLYQHYIKPEAGASPGWLDFIPDLYSQSSDNECFKTAFLGVAALNLANQSSLPRLAAIARHKYGLALKTVNAALTDPQRAIKDEILATLLLICIFAVGDAAQCPNK